MKIKDSWDIMIYNNEYEKLVKVGYIEAGTLVIKVEDITRIELSPEKIKAISKQGARSITKTTLAWII